MVLRRTPRTHASTIVCIAVLIAFIAAGCHPSEGELTGMAKATAIALKSGDWHARHRAVLEAIPHMESDRGLRYVMLRYLLGPGIGDWPYDACEAARMTRGALVPDIIAVLERKDVTKEQFRRALLMLASAGRDAAPGVPVLEAAFADARWSEETKVEVMTVLAGLGQRYDVNAILLHGSLRDPSPEQTAIMELVATTGDGQWMTRAVVARLSEVAADDSAVDACVLSAVMLGVAPNHGSPAEKVAMEACLARLAADETTGIAPAIYALAVAKRYPESAKEHIRLALRLISSRVGGHTFAAFSLCSSLLDERVIAEVAAAANEEKTQDVLLGVCDLVVLVGTRASAAVPGLVRALSPDNDPDLRCAAAMAIAMAIDQKDVWILAEALREEEQRQRSAPTMWERGESERCCEALKAAIAMVRL